MASVGSGNPGRHGTASSRHALYYISEVAFVAHKLIQNTRWATLLAPGRDCRLAGSRQTPDFTIVERDSGGSSRITLAIPSGMVFGYNM
jgi:hypothetical protein